MCVLAWIDKLYMLKRHMYGRASHELLKKAILCSEMELKINVAQSFQVHKSFVSTLSTTNCLSNF